MEKVQVLLSTYNGEKYLREQLDSIFNQNGVIVSVLVRDDGSTDNTISILKEYSDKFDINYYTNGHLGAKFSYIDLMKRCEKTKFDYFAFSDQDDIWLDNKLLTAVEEIKKSNNNNGRLYYSGQKIVDINLKLLSEHNLNVNRNNLARFIFNDAAGCTEVFDRKLLENVNKYYPSYILMHDTWVQKVCIALGGEIIVDRHCYILYRQHGDNSYGLKTDFVSKIKRGIKYIYEQNLEKQVNELLKGYDELIYNEYKEFIYNVISYKKNKTAKEKLKTYNIKFDDKMLDLIYRIKILLNKL